MNKTKYDEYRKKYFPVTIKAEDGYEMIIAIPLKKKNRYLIFPNDTEEIKRMICTDSLIWFNVTNGVISELDFKFNNLDEKSILFGKTVIENHLTTVKNYIGDHYVTIEEAHRFVSRKKTEKFLCQEMYKEDIASETDNDA